MPDVPAPAAPTIETEPLQAADLKRPGSDADSDSPTANRLAATRQRRILDLLETTEEIQVAALSDRWGVSQETIRRDLKALEQAGKLERVYGGAVLRRNLSPEPYPSRIKTLRTEKERIADLCMDAASIEDGQLVFIGGGSTTLPVAERLADGATARFVTNTIDIASALARSGRHEVTLTGGTINYEHELLTGFDTLNAIALRVFDLVITGTNAIDADLGLTEDIELEAQLHRNLSERTRKYIILADHTKFGRRGHFSSLPFTAIESIITDAPPAGPFIRALERSGVRVVW